jgi:SdrD B-like domain/Bacterial Ig-like domain
MSLLRRQHTAAPKRRSFAAAANCEPLEPRRLLASISGVVFEDFDADGVRDANDSVATLRSVYIDANNNGVLDAGDSSMYSQASGYTFSNLAPGQYTVRVVVPAQFRQTWPAIDQPHIVTLADSASTVTGRDFGLTTTLPNTGSIQGRVFQDANANGIWEAEDQPIPSAKIYADMNDNGALDAGEPYVNPDVGGSYKLRAPSGTYRVRGVFPQDYLVSTPAEGYFTYTFNPQYTSLNNNFGAYGFGKVTGSVFDDTNGDGVKSASEPLIPGRTVYADVNLNGVFDPDEPSTVTSATGSFTLNLRPGTYTVRQVVPAGWVQTTPASDPVYEVKSGIGVFPKQWGTHLLSSNPIAHANGPYDVFEGATIVLAGTGESPLNRPITAYEWDFDYNFATFDVDATGATPRFTAAGIDGPDSRSIALRVRDSAGETSDPSVTHVNILDRPPAVTEARFLYAQSPNQVTVTFSEDVGPSLSPANFTVVDRLIGSAVPDPDYSYDPGTKRVTLQWPQPLTDGDYRLTVWASGIHDDVGQPLAADYTFDFFAMAADANHDRKVDFSDLVILAQNYNSSGKTFARGNFDYDPGGNVGFSDLVILAQRYNTTLPPAAGPVASATVAAASPARLRPPTPKSTPPRAIFHTQPPRQPRFYT